MTTRTLFALSFTTALALAISGGVQPLQAEATDQPMVLSTTIQNQEVSGKPVTKAAAEKKKGPPPVQEIKTVVPFVLKGPFRQLPPKTVEDVKFFEGEAAFSQFTDAVNQTVWSIAKFASAAIPKNEPEFRRVLGAHAGKLGADYVVVITNPDEIKRYYSIKSESLVYCAVAYKRVAARLGIERDKAAAEGKVTKVSGFLPGSLAEACGLRVGDVLRKVEGLEPGVTEIYWSKAVRWQVGNKVKVEVERDGKPMEFEVELTAG